MQRPRSRTSLAAEPGQLVVLNHFWIYWAFIIPIMSLVLNLWLFTLLFVTSRLAHCFSSASCASKEAAEGFASFTLRRQTSPAFSSHGSLRIDLPSVDVTGPTSNRGVNHKAETKEMRYTPSFYARSFSNSKQMDISLSRA